MKRDFLTGEELGAVELAELLDLAAELKAARRDGGDLPLAGRSVALVFEKPSTRTRISFEVGVAELGGTPIVLRGDELQLARGESIADTARVLSRYIDAIAIRSGSHEAVAELAAGAEVPVVNALTPRHHPCQALADLLTLRERFGDLHGLRLAYVGDGNNVARSLAIAGERAGVEVVVAAPAGYQLEEGHGAKLTDDPRLAASGADAIYTDVWVSMGDEEEAERRRADLAPFRLDADLLGAAKDSAVVLHCLPAHPGEEIAEEVLYGPRSAVWDQAENRLHTSEGAAQYAARGVGDVPGASHRPDHPPDLRPDVCPRLPCRGRDRLQAAEGAGQADRLGVRDALRGADRRRGRLAGLLRRPELRQRQGRFARATSSPARDWSGTAARSAARSPSCSGPGTATS